MQIVIIAVAGLVGLGIITALGTLLTRKKGETDVVVEPKADCSTCNGSEPRCEQTCMMEAAVKEIEYFDDEELDAFKGRPADGYSDEEVEQFSDVLYTMRPEEAKAWSRSLTLRGINVPDQLKDELFLLIKD